MPVERLNPQAQAVIARRLRCPQCNRVLKRTLYSQHQEEWGYHGEGFCTLRHGYLWAVKNVEELEDYRAARGPV